jgi:hypothetical protein
VEEGDHGGGLGEDLRCENRVLNARSSDWRECVRFFRGYQEKSAPFKAVSRLQGRPMPPHSKTHSDLVSWGGVCSTPCRCLGHDDFLL